MKREIAVPLVLAAFFSLTLAFAVYGANVLRATGPGGDYVRLFAKPCSNDAILARTPAQFRSQMQLGEYHNAGKVNGLCWVALPDGTVGILHDDGDQGRLPMADFKPEVDA